MPRLHLERLESRFVPVVLPNGFTESVLASGLSSPTQMALAPDGRIFVAEQGGDLRVIEDGTVLPAPFASLTVDSRGERGLVGLVLDPNFATNGFVYVYYTVPGSGGTAPHNRVSRFTANGNVAAGGETILLDLDPLSAATNHNGGPMQFGPDGMLYVAVGENANPANAQSLENRLGKVLRINPADGSPAAGNPTAFDRLGGPPAGANTSIWAVGLRNPFALAFQPETGRLFINDVGQVTFEEINDGRAGANYGWNLTEGPNPPGVAGVTYPLYSYPHSGPQPFAGIAITGGAFYNPAVAQFPAGFVGDYFFADLASRWINRLDPESGTVTNFATDLTGSGVVDLDVTTSGELLYLARGPGEGAVYRISFSEGSGAPVPVLAVGSGAGDPAIAKFVAADGSPRGVVNAFGNGFTGGVRVATADVTGDTIPDLIAGAGPGGGPRVTVFDGATGSPVRDFFAFEASFDGGVFVAAADFDGDNFADIAVSPDVGGGPRVQIFSGRDGSVLANFFGIDDPGFRGGARVAAGDVDGDGTPDLVVSAGTGGGPRVAVFDGLTLRPGQTPARLFNDFFAFEETLRDGVFLAVGPVDGDVLGDLVIGAGPGGAPRVIVLSGATLPTAGVSGSTLASFFSGDPAARNGVPVAARDLDADGRAEVVTGSAGGSDPRVRIFEISGGLAMETASFLAFDASFTGGVFVG